MYTCILDTTELQLLGHLNVVLENDPALLQLWGTVEFRIT